MIREASYGPRQSARRESRAGPFPSSQGFWRRWGSRGRVSHSSSRWTDPGHVQDGSKPHRGSSHLNLVDRSEGFPAGTGLAYADFREPAPQVAPVLTGSGPLA